MKQTLLIADPDAELCDLYGRFLMTRGYDVETSLVGLDCLEKLRRVKPALLVLDPELRWGGSDGVLAWLREGRPMSDIPVILTPTAAFTQECSERPSSTTCPSPLRCLFCWRRFARP